MAKSQTILPKLKSLEKLEVLLEILNEKSDRYMPDSELKTEFKERLNPNKKLDNTALENSFNNTITYALGINDKVGRPLIDTPEYLAAIAQIWQTKLIDMEQLPIEGKKENCYMITISGIKVLNQLRNSRHSKGLLTSSRRLEMLARVTGLLTIFLIAITILSISSNSVLIFLVGKTPSFIYFIYLLFFILIGAEILVLLPNLPEWFSEKVKNWRTKIRRRDGK